MFPQPNDDDVAQQQEMVRAPPTGRQPGGYIAVSTATEAPPGVAPSPGGNAEASSGTPALPLAGGGGGVPSSCPPPAIGHGAPAAFVSPNNNNNTNPAYPPAPGSNIGVSSSNGIMPATTMGHQPVGGDDALLSLFQQPIAFALQRPPPQQRQAPEEFTRFTKSQVLVLAGLLLNAVVLRYVGQMDWDYSDKSHDSKHHYRHVAMLAELAKALGSLAVLCYCCAVAGASTQQQHMPLPQSEQPSTASYSPNGVITATTMTTTQPAAAPATPAATTLHGLVAWVKQNTVSACLPIVPALLYHLESVGMVTAYQHLPHRFFELGYQSRLLFLALLSTTRFLGRSYSSQQWLAMAGIVLMAAAMLGEEVINYGGNPETKQHFLGLDVLVGIVACNVMASVLWERILQPQKHAAAAAIGNSGESTASSSLLLDSNVHFWLRAVVYFATTFVLSVVRMLFATSSSPSDEGSSSEPATEYYGFFYGFNGWTWLTILFQAIGGVLVVKTIRSTSCVVEFIATRVSVVTNCVIDAATSSDIAGRFLLVVVLATVAEFACVYAYGVPRSQWPVLRPLRHNNNGAV